MARGIGTSEFWTPLIMTALVTLNTVFNLGISEDTLMYLAGLFAGVIGSRTVVKVMEAKVAIAEAAKPKK